MPVGRGSGLVGEMGRATVPDRQPEVCREIDELQAEIRDLGGVLDRLVDRLGPIRNLSPKPQVPVDAEPPEPARATAIGNNVATCRHDVRTIRLAIMGLIEEVEV